MALVVEQSVPCLLNSSVAFRPQTGEWDTAS